jgi:anti-sigma factor RsiW
MSEHVGDEQLSLLIDGELSLTAREAVRLHLRSCPGCAERHDAMVELTALLRLEPTVVWSPAQTEAVVSRLRARPAWPRLLVAAGWDWALVLAGVVAAVGLLALVWLPGDISGLAAGSIRAFLSLLPSGGFGSGRLLLALAAIVLLGVAAVPLSRSR